MSGNCSCHSKFDPQIIEQVDKLIEPFRGQPGSLIQVLHRAQNLVGYLPKEVQEKVALGLGVPLAKVYGVVSFYSLFTTRPRGRHKISVCAGTACYVRGSSQLLNQLSQELATKSGGISQDGMFTLDVVRCVGACGLGPVVTVDDDVYARVKPEKLSGILSIYTSKAKKE